MSTAYIALGSNLENPARQLQTAVYSIQQLSLSKIIRISSVFQSAAVGPGNQADYLNAVLALQTELSPLQLLDALQGIESRQGRVRTERWGPRPLDLDILLYDKLQMDSARLTLPHASMHQRNFVIYPLAQACAGKLVLPDGTELDTLMANCPAADLVETGLKLESEATCRQ
jgi:2-amino-4-hydroxy-6-hydroxymethyldihydropteridine diphosphokinase